MNRFQIIVEYDGSDFVGWQRQANGPSVQAALEQAVAGFCGEAVLVEGAGRTDAGVHALAQSAHLDLAKETSADTVMAAVNFHLKPAAVAVVAARQVPNSFHARFSAIRRAYLYRIVNRRAPLALEHGHAWFVPQPLDAAAMHEAAQGLVGQHDFTSFRASECQAKSPVKTLDRLTVTQVDRGPSGSVIEIRARARSFLYHQIRNFAGSLKLVGEGKWTARDLRKALEARDRAAAGPTAPAAGLYLTEVGYPEEAFVETES
ncbi:tRNA pseudouridine(38-40) synthase TruA [Pelagibius litoralis]|uniref:tRNA pseudouridine synthase A n=1 Tax=Pelagibius litoralis TaxID=374515 RepID=A0A967F1C9_9PROT|nr:tRNA pseudouridine(38-40) synthase TruA [Pelagibius litoralis]NIA71289.1 tRNA pseudouridine(38-40) synthase TruA [Pelagibius litoralis]